MFPFIKYLKYFILFSFAMLSRNQWWSNFLSLMYHTLLLSCPKDSVQFSSASQLCPTLCDPMNCSTPGLPVHHQLPELTQTHVHRVSEAIQPSHPLWSPSPPGPNPSQHQSFFQALLPKKKKLVEVMEFQLNYFKSKKMLLLKCCTQYAIKFGKLSSGHRTEKGQF